MKKRIKEPNPACEYCHGTGEVRTMEAVDPREPHLTADVGTEPCICTYDPEDTRDETDDIERDY